MNDNYKLNIQECIEKHRALQLYEPSHENAIVIVKLREALLWYREDKAIRQEKIAMEQQNANNKN